MSPSSLWIDFQPNIPENSVVNIVVCMKQIPARDAPLRFDVDTGWVREQDTGFETNEADQYALEEALRLKDAHGGGVLVISLGPERVLQTLREALAKGADRAIHIRDDHYHELEPLHLAAALAGALRPERFDLVLAGLQSDDQGFGQTGVMLAELLDLPHVSLVVEIRHEGENLRARRDVGAGWFQWMSTPLPCLLTVQAGINKPRYATMKGIMTAKAKPVATVSRTQVLPTPLARSQRTIRVFLPEGGRATEYLEGAPEDVAARLFEKLPAVVRP
jgi:electron transfer flavoprotein beta subunit